MSTILKNELRIIKHWRQTAITTGDRELFPRTTRNLAENSRSSTYISARHLDIPCCRPQGYLRRMERLGCVAADNTGFNNI